MRGRERDWPTTVSRRGDTVALFTATCPEWVYFWLGAARIGAVTAAVNVANKDEFLVHALRLSRAKVVITDAERHARLNEIVDRVETARTTLVVGDSLTDALARASNAPPDARPRRSGRVGGAVLHLGHHRAVEGRGNDVALSVLGRGRRRDVMGARGRRRGVERDAVVPPERRAHRCWRRCFSARRRCCRRHSGPSEVWDEIRSCGAAGFAGAGAMVSMLWNQPPETAGLAAAAAVHLGGADRGRYVPRHRAALRRQDRDDVRHDGGVPDRVQEGLRGWCAGNVGTGEPRIRRPHRRR